MPRLPYFPPRPAFQSTLPARGATKSADAAGMPSMHFNPRSLHGERLTIIWTSCLGLSFQSTLPARGATADEDAEQYCLRISIHAPCTGSDWTSCLGLSEKRFQSTLPARGATSFSATGFPSVVNFNPRSLHGERRVLSQQLLQRQRFQSTLPARGATTSSPPTSPISSISIHAPCTGSDRYK